MSILSLPWLFLLFLLLLLAMLKDSSTLEVLPVQSLQDAAATAQAPVMFLPQTAVDYSLASHRCGSMYGNRLAFHSQYAIAVYRGIDI